VANVGWPSGPQRPDVFQLHAQGLFAEEGVQDKKVGAPACSRLSTGFWGESRVQLGAPISPRSRPTFLSCTLEKDNCIKGLILGAGGGILLGRSGETPFQFMFTWQMQRQPFEEVAISPEPGAVSALGRERKMLASNNFRKPPHRFIRIHLAIVIHEQPVVY
jgi:hypothetical protein